MTLLSNDFRLFGVDLRSGVQGLATLWGHVLQGPFFGWLTEPAAVRVLRANGSAETWRDEHLLAPGQEKSPQERPRFAAVEIPDAIVLRHATTMPAMPQAQVADALGLEIQSISPFAAGSLVWGWRAWPASGARLQVEAALASRAHIERLLLSAAQSLAVEPRQLEVWVMPSLPGPTAAPIVLQGFGEGARAGDAQRRQRRAYSFLAIGACLLGLIALTPSTQLWLRARDAAASFAEVQQRTRPVVELREQFVRSSGRLKALESAVGESAAPLRVLEILTNAIPDDTFIQTLQIEGLKISLSGMTENSAALMSRLGGTPGIRELKASQAATRQPGAAKESFGVEFVLDIPGVVPRTAVAKVEASAATMPTPPVPAPAPVLESPAPTPAPVSPALLPAAPGKPAYPPLAPAEQPPAPGTTSNAPNASGAQVDPLSRATIGGRASSPAPAPNP
ncbi:PilN domain-containing protein [Xylophilus sp. GW821-FHT01B05]